MKTNILAFLLLISIEAYSQKWEKSVNANYNWTYISQSIEGDFNFRLGHNTLSAGMQVYLDTYPDFDEGSYKNAAHADAWYNLLGVNFSYHYYIWKETRTVNPFVYYQNLLSHLCFYKCGDMGPFDDWRGYGETDPYWITENVVGMGFEFELWKSINVFQSAGVGYSWFFGDDDYIISAPSEWTYAVKLGLLYRID